MCASLVRALSAVFPLSHSHAIIAAVAASACEVLAGGGHASSKSNSDAGITLERVGGVGGERGCVRT